jgi:hypothetical protein
MFSSLGVMAYTRRLTIGGNLFPSPSFDRVENIILVSNEQSGGGGAKIRPNEHAPSAAGIKQVWIWQLERCRPISPWMMSQIKEL